MADVRPLPGIRYAATENLAALVTPPYDVISPEAQERYYARDPHNIIRLELGRDEPGDDSLNNKYTRAATLFAEWRLEGVMRQDAPSLYVYEQTFSVADAERRRMGLLARVRLEPWDARVILPHERTMSKPKDDRLKLFHACAANLSPLMSLYDDPDQELSAILNEATTSAPDADFADDAGERHRLWRLDDPALAQTVAAFFAPRQLYIADGHHRYETSLTYRDEVRADRKETFADDATDFVLMSLTAIEDPGLVVLPTHRILRGASADDLAALPERLERHFTLTPLEGDSAEEWRTSLVEAGANAPSIALVTQRPRLAGDAERRRARGDGGRDGRGADAWRGVARAGCRRASGARLRRGARRHARRHSRRRAGDLHARRRGGGVALYAREPMARVSRRY